MQTSNTILCLYKVRYFYSLTGFLHTTVDLMVKYIFLSSSSTLKQLLFSALCLHNVSVWHVITARMATRILLTRLFTGMESDFSNAFNALALRLRGSRAECSETHTAVTPAQSKFTPDDEMLKRWRMERGREMWIIRSDRERMGIYIEREHSEKGE